MKLSSFIVGCVVLFGHRDNFFLDAQIRKYSKKTASPTPFAIPPEPKEGTCPLLNDIAPLVHVSKTRTLLDEDDFGEENFVPKIGADGNAEGTQTITKGKYYNAAALYFDEDGTLVKTTKELGTVTTTCTVKKGRLNTRQEIVVNTFECVDATCSGDDALNCVSSQSVEEFKDGFILGGSKLYFSRFNGRITCGTGLYEGLSMGEFSSIQVDPPSEGGPAVFENEYAIEIESGPLFSEFEALIDNANGDETTARNYVHLADQLNLCNIDVVTSLKSPSAFIETEKAYTASLNVGNGESSTGNSYELFYSQEKLNEYRRACDDVGLTFKTYPELSLTCTSFDVKYHNFAKCTSDSDSCTGVDLNQFLLENNNVVHGNGCEVSSRKLALPLSTTSTSTSTSKEELDSNDRTSIEEYSLSIQTRSLEEDCPLYCSYIQVFTNPFCKKCDFVKKAEKDPFTNLPNDLCDTSCSPVQCGNSPMCTGCDFCIDGLICKSVKKLLETEGETKLCNFPKKLAERQRTIDGLLSTGQWQNTAGFQRLRQATDYTYGGVYYGWGYFNLISGSNGDPCSDTSCSDCSECKDGNRQCDSWCSKLNCGTATFPPIPNCIGCQFCKQTLEEIGSPCKSYCSRRMVGSQPCLGCTFMDEPVCDSFCSVTNKAVACQDCKTTTLKNADKLYCDSYCNVLTCNFGKDAPDGNIDECKDCASMYNIGCPTDSTVALSTNEQDIKDIF